MGMPSYRVAVEGLSDLHISCHGCSGDALSLALTDLGLCSFKVDRRSQDGRQWFFHATFKAGSIDLPEAGSVTRLARVDRIND
jgi:hypothetical protein